MPTHLPARLAAFALVAASAGAAALEIQFDYRFDGDFFSGANEGRRALLEAAAAEYETRFGDSLAAIEPQPSDQFQVVFTRPDGAGTAMIDDFSVPADTLVVFAGARQLDTTLGQAGPGGFGGTSSFFNFAQARGQDGVFEGAGANNFSPWGGALAFDIDNNWYFDDDVSTLEPFAGEDDFFSVAIHELGHVLGFGTSDSFDARVDEANRVFTGDAAAAVFGDDVPLFFNEITQQVDEGHFAEDILSPDADGNLQQPAMSPRLLVGSRKTLTELDVAAFYDIGWEAVVVPVPAAWLLFASALGLLGLRRRASMR